ncbi:F-box/FBD/LRR-repeat protein [Trifolium repens]|nr:F-box/FBD/LRR-repeat protein [Trifolium repens]
MFQSLTHLELNFYKLKLSSPRWTWLLEILKLCPKLQNLIVKDNKVLDETNDECWKDPPHIPNGNFRREQFNYDYRIPHWGFHYVDGMYLPYQMPVHYAHNMRLPYQTPAHYYGMRHSTHQMPAHYPYMRPLPQQMRPHYADKRHLPQQKPKQCADKRPLPHQMPKDFVDKKTSQHKKPEDFADKKTLPHKKMEDLADQKNLPHQKSEDFTDNKCLPQQTSDLPKQTPNLPQQTPEDHTDKNNLPHQTSEPTIPAVAPIQCPEKTIVSYCEICDVSFPQKSSEHHNNGKKHQRNLSKPCEQSKKCKTSKEQHEIQHCALEKNDQPNSISKELQALAGSNNNTLTEGTCSGSGAIAIAPPQGPMSSQIVSQTIVEEGKGHHKVQNCGEKDRADKKGLPHQMPKPTIPSDKKCLRCEICHVMIPSSNIKEHNNGRRHRENVKSMQHKISKGKESRHIRNSQMNSVEKVLKSMKDGRPVENIREAPRFRCKEVPAEGSKRKLKDHTGAKDRGFKVKIEKNEDASIKIEKVPADRSKRKVRDDNTDVKDHGLKREIGEASEGKYMKTNNGIRRLVKSSKPEVNAISNSVKTPVRIPELTSSGHTTSPKMAQIPVEGSNFELQSQHVSASLEGRFWQSNSSFKLFKVLCPKASNLLLFINEGGAYVDLKLCDEIVPAVDSTFFNQIRECSSDKTALTALIRF